ncbi:MAG: membrane protein insertase YidC [Lysobacteraceae bacterium]|jgi:YidC/Oxa1 family membrane protein insertase|nr:membrane protein insertase YidC [Xanthomonadaceae bacterium]MCZ8319526.1 membrane protein insertase YidC [Silanimonas sp.]
MNQNRALLLFAWVAVAILLAFEWTRFTATPPAPAAAASAAATATATPVASAMPGADALPEPASATPTAPTPPAQPGLEAAPIAGAAPAAPPAGAPPTAETVEVRTDVLRLRISAAGGSLVFAELLDYPVDQENPERGNVILLNQDPSTFDVAQSGWISTAAAPGVESAYVFEGGTAPRVLAEGEDQISVPMAWTDAATGLVVRKVYTFSRGSYAIRVRHEVLNEGSVAFTGHLFQQLLRVPPPPPPKHAMFTNPETFSFVGAAWYSPEDHFEKRKFADFAGDGPLNKTVTGGWIAMLQHHFASAWLPPADERHQFSLAALDGQRFAIRSVGDAITVAPAAQAAVDLDLWVGPKLQEPMKVLAPSLPLTLDYGIFSFLAQPLFWVLDQLHGLFGNWGWAIIGIVVLLKLVLFPLSAKQYQSMAKMRAVAPRIEQLKERYGEDRMKFNQAMMELYQKEKINPLGGCLPMLLPIPIFLALYWVLLESVELRQAPWALWIDNLTAPDPWFVLPALNLLVMWATQKLTPSPGMDPTQQKILQWMPVVFGVMFAFFPAGLVLYWLTNGLLGLAQQWWMTKRYGAPAAPVVAKAK